MRYTTLVLFALVGCYESDAPTCTISCADTSDCPGDLLCGPEGKCSTNAEACTITPDMCTANSFLSCTNAETAQLCNATGDGVETQACGAPGCNETAQRCNACVPDEVSCAPGMPLLMRCDPQGMSTAMVGQCDLGCADASGPTPAHCKTIQPLYLPDICDAQAMTPSITFNTMGSIDTGVDTNCTMVVPQMSGPAICVIRAGTIRVASTMTVTGFRLIAFVADDALDITGTLDVSASVNAQGARLSGPGGGSIISGTKGSSSGPGGGGAGFKTAGAAGGGAGAGGGGAAGAIQNPLILNHMPGGPRPPPPSTMVFEFNGSSGGGGGGLLLVSCRGTVTVAGTIDAGGGGGAGGQDQVGGTGISFTGAGAGGAGGYVVMQGAQVNVTPMAQTFANGGGGGGGTTADNGVGNPGEDGPRANARAQGGAAIGSGGAGGTGGAATSLPGVGGGSTSSSGGGGGSMGMFQVYTPAMVLPVIMPGATSPNFETSRNIPTR